MKQTASPDRRSEHNGAKRKARKNAPVNRVDLELPDGRYLLVYSKTRDA